ncbi:MAG: hypothetical protein AAF557_15565 [Pseudomonadota bacterium]
MKALITLIVVLTLPLTSNATSSLSISPGNPCEGGITLNKCLIFTHKNVLGSLQKGRNEIINSEISNESKEEKLQKLDVMIEGVRQKIKELQ